MVQKIEEFYRDLDYYCKLNGFTTKEKDVTFWFFKYAHLRKNLRRLYKKIETLQNDYINKPVEVTINSLPKHYKKPYTPIDFILKWGLDFSEGNFLKYITRYKEKANIFDLEKCKYYSTTYFYNNDSIYKEYVETNSIK